MTPALSIIIPSHRRADLLVLCLDSVIRHAPARTEIIVIDDGSRDGIIARTAVRFAGVTILRNARSRGFCHAVNQGIAVARAPIIELLNDDTQVSPGWADAALSPFDDPQIGAVAPLVLRGSPQTNPNPPIIDSAGDGYDVGGFARKRGHGERFGADYMVGCDVFGASGSSAFYRRDALRKTGLFPGEFRAYFEDVDLSFRLHRAGFRVRFEPRSVVWHEVSASHGCGSWRLIQQQSCNEERVFWRHIPRELMGRALPRHVLVLAGKVLRRWREGTLMPWCWGRIRAWIEAREYIRYRRGWAKSNPEDWCLDLQK